MVKDRWGESPYLADANFTATDIMSLLPLTTMRLFAPRDIAGYPNIAAYRQRIGSHDVFQRTTAKADLGFIVPLN